MATTTQTDFSSLDGSALSGDFVHAMAVQLDRLARRMLSRAALPSNDSLAGPSVADLTPGLANETSRL